LLFREYVPELERARAARDASLQAIKKDSMNRMMKDLEVDRKDPNFRAQDQWDPEEEDEDDGGEATIIDRCELRLSSYDMSICVG
jgi:hypothetical protein